VDRLLSSARLVDLHAPVCGDRIRVIDCILEAHNYCFHFISRLKAARNGETVIIPPFRHSDSFFELT
ncbi:MAG TPA: hypothetical protein VMW87_00350, partial [Spirochaetia bacterium]|nr:hypothetical protein [Spirochaetia bacterium]